MKMIILICFLILSTAHVTVAQLKSPDLTGTWRILTKVSGAKKPPPPDYVLLMDDSVYTIGVDSLGNTLSRSSSGRWTVLHDGMLLLFPSDRIAERRYYQPSGENRFKYVGTTLKKSQPVLEKEVYLEKFE